MIRHIFTHEINTTIYTDQSRTINFSSQHFFISLLKFSFAVVKPTRIKGAKLFIRGRGYNRLPDPLSHQRATSCETISRRKRRWDNVFPLNLSTPCIIFGTWITSPSYHAYEGRENVPLKDDRLNLRSTDNRCHSLFVLYPFENNVSKCKTTKLTRSILYIFIHTIIITICENNNCNRIINKIHQPFIV